MNFKEFLMDKENISEVINFQHKVKLVFIVSLKSLQKLSKLIKLESVMQWFYNRQHENTE